MSLEGKITKRLISILLVLVIALSAAVPVYAASGLNAAEIQVLKMMDRGAKSDAGFFQYRNALKTYFNRDNVSITQIQADNACDRLLRYYDAYEPDDPQNEKKFFDAFLYVMMYLGIRAIYDRANSTADFIGSDGSLVMAKLELKNVDSGGRTVILNPIKRTGTDAVIPLAGGSVAALAAIGVIVLFVKRKGKKEENGN